MLEKSMKRVFVPLALGFGLAHSTGHTTELALGPCRGILNADERLSCYDALADGGLRFHQTGHGGAEFQHIDLAATDTLVFRNRDVVMVVTVLNAAQDVVQNLHIGGASTERFHARTEGAYNLQIDATGNWDLWVEATTADAR